MKDNKYEFNEIEAFPSYSNEIARLVSFLLTMIKFPLIEIELHLY